LQALKRERTEAGTIEIPSSHLTAMQALASDLGIPAPEVIAG